MHNLGYKRMQKVHLERSLDKLGWSASNENPLWEKEDLDEHAILAILRACTTRALGDCTEAKRILQEEVLSHEWKEFTGHLRDNWTAPCARYELSIIAWTQFKGDTENRALLQECSDWLEKVARWESFELDARIGMR